jgi:hypothetical protein
VRKYSIVTPQRWYGQTGKSLSRAIQSREKGDPMREAYKDAQIVADVLLTNPNANQWGLYYITINMVTELSGLTSAEVEAAFKILRDEHFAYYDSAFVWVREMARVQMHLPLKPGDKNIVTVNNWYAHLPQNAFLGEFYDRYVNDLRLSFRREHYMDSALRLEPAAPNSNGGPPTTSLMEYWFMVFIEAYPSSRRDGGRQAEEAFAEAMAGKDEKFLALLCEALYYQKRSEQWRRNVIPSMVKWLREKQWIRDLPTGQSKLIGGPPFECEHGCRGPGQHALRVEVERFCEHEPRCESVISHYNRQMEDASHGESNDADQQS